MKKSAAINAIAILMSLFFCVIYFGFFTKLNELDPNKTVSNITPIPVMARSNPPIEKPDKMTLYWVQLGVFAKQQSVEQLEDRLKKDGFESLIFVKNDLSIIVSGISSDNAATTKQKEKLDQLEYDTILKSAELRNEEQFEQVAKKNFKEILEGLK